MQQSPHKTPIELSYESRPRSLPIFALLIIGLGQAAMFFALYAGRHWSSSAVFHSDAILFGAPSGIAFSLQFWLASRRLHLGWAAGLALLLCAIGEFVGAILAFNTFGT